MEHEEPPATVVLFISGEAFSAPEIYYFAFRLSAIIVTIIFDVLLLILDLFFVYGIVI